MTGPAILDGSATDKLPDEFVEGAKFLLHLEEGFRVGDGGLDFEAVADNAGIAEEGSRLLGVIARHFRGIEAAKELAIAFALLENGVPTEASLRAFEDEEFEPDAIVVDGDTPFFIVIFGIERIAGPGAASNVLLCGHREDSLAQCVRRVIREKTERITTEGLEVSGENGGRKKRGASPGRRLWREQRRA